jgi:hypothetical protein
MLSSRFGLCLLFALALGACEFHAGNANWDASWPFDDDDAGSNDTPARDAGHGDGKPDARTVDDNANDAGPQAVDAAVSGHDDAAKPDATVPDAAVPDASTQEPGDSTLTPDDVAAVMARGTCGALERCLGKPLLLDSLAGKDCVAYRTHVYADRDFHWLAKSVALGRLTFQPQLLAQCEKDLIARGCDVQSRRLPSSCEDALASKADLDEACAIDQECAGTAFCDKGMLETCPGSCVSLQTAGLPCSASAQCADGLVCRSRVCATPLADGAACTTRLGYGECAPGFACQGATGKLTCQSNESIYVGKLAQSCDGFGKLCSSGLVCTSTSASNTQGVCAAPVAAGESCKPSAPGQCPVEQYCKDARANVSTRAPAGTAGRCSDLPDAGKACDVKIGCKPGVICSGTDTICHALQPDGEACAENVECYGGSCQSGQCAPPLDCHE